MRLAECDQRNAVFAASLALALGRFAGVNLRRTGATAACEARQCLECCARSAEMVEQRAEGPRADILTADEPQPVEPLLASRAHCKSAK